MDLFSLHLIIFSIQVNIIRILFIFTPFFLVFILLAAETGNDDDDDDEKDDDTHNSNDDKNDLLRQFIRHHCLC